MGHFRETLGVELVTREGDAGVIISEFGHFVGVDRQVFDHFREVSVDTLHDAEVGSDVVGFGGLHDLLGSLELLALADKIIFVVDVE